VSVSLGFFQTERQPVLHIHACLSQACISALNSVIDGVTEL